MYTYPAAIVLFLPAALGVWCVGGRREWSLQLLTHALFWSGFALHLLVLSRLFLENRRAPGDADPVSWKQILAVWAILLPWIAALLLSWRGTYNPAFVPLDNTLLSPVLPLAHAENQPTSVNPIRSRLHLAFYAALTVYLAGAWLTLRTRRAIRLLLILIFANGALLTLLGIATKAAGSEKILGLIDSHTTSFFATIYYKNHWGGLVVLWLGAGMGLAADSWKRARKAERFPDLAVACLFLILPMLLSVALAQARASVILATGLTLLFGVGLLRTAPGHRKRAIEIGARAAVLAGVAVSLFWIAGPDIDRMYERSELQISRLMADDVLHPDARLSAYRSTVSLIAERPVWGWGAGSFPYVFPFHAEDVLIQADGKPLFFEFAHNDYLQLFAEQGAAGGSLILLTPVLTLLFCRRYGRSALATWIACGLGGVLLLALVDFPFGNPSVTATFWLLFVACLAHRRLSTRRAAERTAG